MNSFKNQSRIAGKAWGLFPAAVFVLFVLSGAPAGAQQHHREASDEFRITFPVSKYILDREYRYNARAFAHLDSLLAVRGQVFVDSVIVVSKSSPEGPFKGNEALSVNRSKAIYDYVVSAYPNLADKVRVSSEVESWGEFAQMVSEDPTLSSATRADALAIIDSELAPDAKKAQLRRLKEYNYFLKYYFPALRFSAIVVVFDRAAIEGPQVPVLETSGLLQEDFTVPVEEIELSRPRLVIPPLTQRRMLAAVKTNLLYDVATVLNFEVEVPIADRYSVMVEDVFPWWETGNKYCLQMWEIGIEPRIWLRAWDPAGVKKLRGWFAGLYAMSSKYDFQIDRNLNYQGEYWSAGVSAGYTMPIGRRKRVNLEFSVAAGFLQTDYRHYMPTESYDKLIRDRYRVGKASYFGPTKAKISLVVPINIRYTSGKEVYYE